MPPLTAFVVSHTHWDREWYQPFQEFRVRLVAMVDRLLDLLDADPDYRHFMLDGQTIVLDDYLTIRPDRRGDLQRHVASGRLLVGPWYILPDEFLVGPESLVRNLLIGRETARRFGEPMPVGYIPDTFGHISQLPQVLNGFGLATTAIWRGLPDLPTVFSWRSPDGSAVTAANLREGYGDLAWAPADADGFTEVVRQAVARLAPYAGVPLVLLSDGSDHLEARPDVPALLEAANWRLAGEGIRVVHGTLPQYFSGVAKAGPALVEAAGEFRGSRRNNILPGVLSARMWIKQRNREIETLLTTWAEPLSAIAGAVAPGVDALSAAAFAGLLREAWRLLLQNQPHDSICGCSVDQVHEEMRARYDQAEQIGEELTRRGLSAIAGQVNSIAPGGAPAIPIVVFNPASVSTSSAVTVQVQVPPAWQGIEVTSAGGEILPHVVTGHEIVEFSSLGVDPMDVVTRLSTESAERICGQEVLSLAWRRQRGKLHITALLGGHGLGDREAVGAAAAEIRALVSAQPGLSPVFHITMVPRTEMTILAEGVPPLGYTTLWVRPSREPEKFANLRGGQAFQLENEYLCVEASPTDGSLTVTDRRTGQVFPGLNRLVDDGDCGDEYNFCPVSGGALVPTPDGQLTVVKLDLGDLGGTLEVIATYRLPVGLVAGRSRRASRTVPVELVTRATVLRGVPRIDIETIVDNTARDHRLRVAFPFPAAAEMWRTETPWDVIERPVTARDLETDPAYDAWQERPVAQQPQYRFCDVSSSDAGLMLANRGLPEVEARRDAGGVTLYLTLLRSVGWLSRDDLAVRRGHAGPGLPTPGAQFLGRHAFQYSIIPHGGDWQAAVPQALAFASPPRGVPARAAFGALPPRRSFVRVEPGSVIVSGLKLSEDGESVVLRLWNAGDEDVIARVHLGLVAAGARLARLDETPGEALAIGDGEIIEAPVWRRQAVTLLLTP